MIAHCCRCMRASHGRGPPNDPEHQWELVQRDGGETEGRGERRGKSKRGVGATVITNRVDLRPV